MYRFATDAISPTEHVRSNSTRSNRTRTRQRQRRPSALFAAPRLSDSDQNAEDESGESFERSSTMGRPRSSLQFRKRIEKYSSSSEDANISSASPISSAEEVNLIEMHWRFSFYHRILHWRTLWMPPFRMRFSRTFFRLRRKRTSVLSPRSWRLLPSVARCL